MRTLQTLLALVMVLHATPVGAQEEPAPPPAASPYATKVQSGLRMAATRDFAGAIAAFREAIQEDPSKPEAYYHLASTLRMSGELNEALENFQSCGRMASQASDGQAEARCLQGVAETYERQEGGLEQARQAWVAYSQYADGHRNSANPELARARIQAIDTLSEQERVYVDVRQRIVDRVQENAEREAEQQSRQRRRRRRR